MLLSRSICLKAVVTLAIATAVPISTAIPAIAAMGDWSYSPQTGELGFALDSAEKPKYFLMANPMRIVVDLPGATQDLQVLEAQAGGVFTQIRAAETESGQTRLVLQLAPGTVLQPGQVELTALADGRWSLRPLLAEGQVFSAPAESAGSAPLAAAELENVAEVTVQSAESDEFNEFMDGPLEVVESPSLTLPILKDAEAEELSEAMADGAVAAESEPTEFVSMEETLARQQAIAASPPAGSMPEETMNNLAVKDFVDSSAEGEIAWGSSQLPPLPTSIAVGNRADRMSVPAATESTVLPRLPQPQLGQAPFAFEAPQSALVDPAQVVDMGQLSQSSLRSRPPAEIKPVLDPKLLSLDGQSAAALGGQTGLVLSPGRAVQTVPVKSDAMEQEGALTDESVPFLVEFGAPLPGVIPETGAL